LGEEEPKLVEEQILESQLEQRRLAKPQEQRELQELFVELPARRCYQGLRPSYLAPLLRAL
jgi:hypothetical protein